MDEGTLRDLASEFLLPFFSGASLDQRSISSSNQDSVVALLGSQTIAFKVERGGSYRLVMRRSQPFAKNDGKVIVPEIDVVKAFVAVLGTMTPILETDFASDILSSFQRRVVAKSITPHERWEEALLLGIDQLSKWANRLYEGSPISAAIGFRQTPQPEGTPTLADIAAQDFGALLSNGYDTLLQFDTEGRFLSHVSLPSPGNPEAYCPFRQIPLAEWTLGDEKRRRVALSLNRLGEVLVMRDGQLLFARRSGRWSFLTHDPVLTQMGTPHNKSIRRAVYETCLDASFARTGARIGIVSSSNGANWRGTAVHKQDHIADGSSIKARAIAKIVGTAKFHELDRRLRQELVAIDGATVISHEGDLLAVGAILKIPGGSAGGGRLAAAKQLATLGLGIKVSQDGGIVGFRYLKEAFRIM